MPDDKDDAAKGWWAVSEDDIGFRVQIEWQPDVCKVRGTKPWIRYVARRSPLVRDVAIWEAPGAVHIRLRLPRWLWLTLGVGHYLVARRVRRDLEGGRPAGIAYSVSTR